jgi:hypothetical protein
MLTAPVIMAVVISAIGLLLNCGMLYMVLSRGKKIYHYLFSAVLMICALWDLGILLSMLRNTDLPIHHHLFRSVKEKNNHLLVVFQRAWGYRTRDWIRWKN